MISEKIELRLIGENDVTFIHQLYSDWQVVRYLGKVPFPYELMEAKRTVERMMRENVNRRNQNSIIVDRSTGESCGVIVLNELFAVRAVLGFSVVRKYQGCGFATQAGQMMITFAISQGFEEIQASSLQENMASQKVLKKLGFIVEETGVEESSMHSGIRLADRWVWKVS